MGAIMSGVVGDAQLQEIPEGYVQARLERNREAYRDWQKDHAKKHAKVAFEPEEEFDSTPEDEIAIAALQKMEKSWDIKKRRTKSTISKGHHHHVVQGSVSAKLDSFDVESRHEEILTLQRELSEYDVPEAIPEAEESTITLPEANASQTLVVADVKVKTDQEPAYDHSIPEPDANDNEMIDDCEDQKCEEERHNWNCCKPRSKLPLLRGAKIPKGSCTASKAEVNHGELALRVPNKVPIDIALVVKLVDLPEVNVFCTYDSARKAGALHTTDPRDILSHLCIKVDKNGDSNDAKSFIKAIPNIMNSFDAVLTLNGYRISVDHIQCRRIHVLSLNLDANPLILNLSPKGLSGVKVYRSEKKVTYQGEPEAGSEPKSIRVDGENSTQIKKIRIVSPTPENGTKFQLCFPTD